MAESKQIISAEAEGKAKDLSLIDSLYLRYTKSVIRALGSTDFYEYFMDTIAGADNQIQFSNRKMEKLIDESWVEAIEEALPGIQAIIDRPRNVIQEEELIMNVGLAKKSDSSVVRHLAQHGSTMIDDYDPKTGEVNPSKLMQKLRDDSTIIYENRLVITVLEDAYHFVRIRYDALMNLLSDEYGAKLKVTSDMLSSTEQLHMDMYLHIRERDDILSTDDKHRNMLNRISRLDRLLTGFMATPFAQSLMKATRVKGAIVKTNALKKNPNYKAIVKLYDFLHNYHDVGYAIKVTEQSPVINEDFQRDIFHNVLFNYIVLKNYLEDETDRVLPTPVKDRKRTLKPKFITEIIEEFTEDYDLPDVEIRKVLIEELTKAQLMAEEEAERRRIVEENERRKKEEEERLRKEQEAEEERLRMEQEKEAERIRKEEEEAERIRNLERLQREIEDRRRGKLFRQELAAFSENLEKNIALRNQEAEERRLNEARQDFADAAKILEEQEQRKRDEAERLRRRQEEVKAALEREKMQQKAAEENARREAEEAKRRAAEEAERKKDEEQMKPYIGEIKNFGTMLEAQKNKRKEYAEEQARLEEERKLRKQRKSENAPRKKSRNGGNG